MKAKHPRFDWPSCPQCRAMMRLVRIAPVMLISPMRVERTYECACGATLLFEEPPHLPAPGARDA